MPIIKYQVRQSYSLNRFLASLPRGTVKIALPAFVKYIVGNAFHGLKHEDPYRYVSRKAAYGKTFESDAQRGYVMAKIRSGEITPGIPQRTGLSAAAWAYTPHGDYQYTIVNPTAGAYFSHDDSGQARQSELAGKRKVSQIISDNFNGGIRAAQAAVKAWVKKNRK